jgi:Xaa-Pro aminopeptidase
VIEPGIYIRSDALERYPKSSANPALVKRLTPLIEQYRHIGVRVEDSFLMTPKGPEMLSGRAPRRVADIERVVGTAR